MPFNFWTWTRLAIIVLFLGAGGFFNVFQVPMDSSHSTEPTWGSQEAMTGMATASPSLGVFAAAIAVAVLAGVFLLILFLNSVFRFVMFASMRDEEVRIRRNFSNHFFDGVKYMVFEILYLSILAGIVIGWFASIAMQPAIGLMLTIPALPALIVLGILGGVIHDFGLQKVIEADRGFFKSLIEGLKDATYSWKQFAGYILIKWALSAAISIITMVLVLMITFILLIPFAIIGIAAAAVSEILVLLLAIPGFLIWLIGVLYIMVPFRTFMFCYLVELYDAFTA